MAYFIVFQNKTFKEELKGGYLWAPIKTENGKSVHHWSRMEEVQPGDIIFSVVKQKVVSVNQATDSAVTEAKPIELGNEWINEGYLVKVKYNHLKNPFDLKGNMNEILPLAEHKYSPFASSGRGNQGYLFSIKDELGEYFIERINRENKLGNFNNKTNVIKIDEADLLLEVEHIKGLLEKNIKETTKDQLVKIRVGQGIFRERLFTRSSSCEICDIDFKPLLRASHCKPWSKSNNEERLSINNGLLLCVEHDVLFDNGFIAFNEGELIISQHVPQSIREKLKPYINRKHKFNEEQQEFINWHKNYLFKVDK